MSFEDRDLFLVREILESIDLIFQFVSEMTEQEFAQDLKTQAAVTMMLQRVGEAGSKLSLPTKRKTQLDWAIIIGLRNRISHSYGSIDHEITWSIIKNDLRLMRKQIARLL